MKNEMKFTRSKLGLDSSLTLGIRSGLDQIRVKSKVRVMYKVRLRYEVRLLV